MKKVLVMTTINSTINAFLIPHIKKIIELGNKVDCACSITSEVDSRLEEMKIKTYDLPFTRNPLDFRNLKAFKELKNLQKKEKYDVLFVHTPIAGMYGRFLKLFSKNLKVVYMAHGFHFFKGAPKINWLVYYPIEKVCSYFTDVLITINQEDYNFAKQKMKAKQIFYVPGVGLDTKKFANVVVDKEQKRKELGIKETDKMILSVGELSKRKNHEVVIRALAKINRDDIHYFIAGRGNLKEYLVNLSKELKVEDKVHFLDFRKDIAELCKASDIFCFPSKQEGLPVALMEAMAVGVPVVCSEIRGNNELIKDNVNGFLCNPSSVDEFCEAILKIINDDKLNEEFRENNKKDISKFDIENVMKEMEKVYEFF